MDNGERKQLPALKCRSFATTAPVDPQADLAMCVGTYPNESWFAVAKLTARPP